MTEKELSNALGGTAALFIVMAILLISSSWAGFIENEKWERVSLWAGIILAATIPVMILADIWSEVWL